MQDLWSCLAAAHKSSALPVTHDLDEAFLLADRLILMSGGSKTGDTVLAEWPLTPVLGPPGPDGERAELVSGRDLRTVSLRRKISQRLFFETRSKYR